MLFRQFVDDDLGCASYLIGDEESGEAVVVDPAYEIEQYVDEAARSGVRITRVLETHTHADHVSGHGRFALERATPVAIHPAAEPDYPFKPLDDGTRLEIGSLELRVLHTPGHRPEHCCFLVGDVVLTGDSLLVGGAARPDLAVAAREGAEALFHSLQRLLELPDAVRVHPGHVAGSLCGAGIGTEPHSTIGLERRFNPSLAHAAADDFVRASAGVSDPRPPNMEAIVDLNRGPFVGAPAPLEPVRLHDADAVLDVRGADEFAAGHVAGAINVPLERGFGTRAAFVLDGGDRIVIDATTAAAAGEAAQRLHAVGFLELGGYLVDPPRDATLHPVELDELDRLVREGTVLVLDVREPHERDGAYIAGSRNVPYRMLRLCLDAVGRERPVVTICESGARAAVAASVLAAAGIDARPVLGGGMPDWIAGGKATVSFRRCGR